MMEKTELFVLPTADSLTLFWDKPQKAPKNAHYTVLLNNGTTVNVEHTHATLEGLSPDTAYEAEVRMENLVIGSISARTKKRPRRLDVRDYGAAGDGRTVDTSALQHALDDCGAEEEVYIPAGVFVTGALRLHSNMALYLDEGAVLQGTNDPTDYLPRIRSRFEGIERECYSSLLNLGQLDHDAGPNCENVLIYGKGTIASGGMVLAKRIIESETERLRDFLAANTALVEECDCDRTIPGRVRPRLINLSNCRNIRISGLTLRDSASWNVHMIYSDRITTDHCTFLSQHVWNGDGWDPDSSENCTLFASQFRTGDDAVAIKSGKNPEGNQIARPSRHIRVFDCVSEGGLGVCIGSEISGGIEDVRIWDCDLRSSAYGVRIKATKKRGAYVRDVSVRDCAVPRVSALAVTFNDDGEAAPEPPVFENFLFEGLTMTGHALILDSDGEWENVPSVELFGFDVPGYEVRNVLFRDCVMEGGKNAIVMEHCKEIAFENISAKP